MKVASRQVFLTMFDALDAAWDEGKTERLRSFLSEANPFLWAGGGSADPAVFAEFADAFASRFPGGKAEPEDALVFVRGYLSEQNNAYDWVDGDLVSAFDTVVTPELWEQALADAPE